MTGFARYISFGIILFLSIGACAQDKFMDPEIRELFDSLDQRIVHLESRLPVLSKSRNLDFYYTRRELDMTRFVRDFEGFVFNEELDEAEHLIQSRQKGAVKRNDKDAIVFYKEYKSRLKQERQANYERYQQLFAKEKNFKKEFYRFVEVGDEYSLNRAKRMTELAIKYANQRGLVTPLEFLKKYSEIIALKLFDYHSEYDLSKLTENESGFNKVFQPMIETDSLEIIKEAGELVDHCYTYSSISKSGLDTNFFALQRNVVATSISDWYARKGISAELSEMSGQAVIVRFDTLNREGIYKWHEFIVVIDNIKPKGYFTNVKQGEAIIQADRKLYNYIRINRLAKIKEEFEVGETFFIPYYLDQKEADFHYNKEKGAWQYMICYKNIVNSIYTKQVSKFLPPMLFLEETKEMADSG